MSGIAFHLKINNLPDATKSFIIQKLQVGLCRKQPSVDICRPITLKLLHRIIQVLPSTYKSSYESTLFTSALLLAYFGFLRVGELAITSDRVLQFSAVSFANNSIQLFLKFSKTDQDGKGDTCTIVIPIRNDQLILQQALKKNISIRPPTPGPFLCHFDEKPLTSYQLSAILAKTIGYLKIPQATFKSHSFRISAATAAFVKDMPEHEIQARGRWKSMCYKNYIRLQLVYNLSTRIISCNANTNQVFAGQAPNIWIIG